MRRYQVLLVLVILGRKSSFSHRIPNNNIIIIVLFT